MDPRCPVRDPFDDRHLPAALTAAYRSAIYEFWFEERWQTILLGGRAPAVERYLAEAAATQGCMIGAANPGSRPLPAATNWRRQAALGAALPSSRRPARAYASDGGWYEPMWVYAGEHLAEALGRARAYGQLAIVWLERGRPPRIAYTGLVAG